MTAHIAESSLALFVSGDLSLGRGFGVRLHVARCERCRKRLDAFRADQAQLRQIASEMPPDLSSDVDWDRLAAEMTANIRVGLAAGECVAPRRRKAVPFGWRPAAAMAGLAVVLVSAWWLNMPASTTQALGRAMTAVWHGHGSVMQEERGLVVEATPSGIELRENGGTLGVSQGTARPVSFSVSVQGSASASYVNADTGQMTITSVYAQ
jgi:hypothetical protein